MGHDKISSAEDEGGVPQQLDALLENQGVYTIVWVFFLGLGGDCRTELGRASKHNNMAGRDTLIR